MKVLLIGGGGREHALAWAIARSPRLRLLRVAPGNAGIEELAETVPIGANDIERLAIHATEERYDLIVIGPEAPLVAGLADRLREAGLRVFGPGARAAELEGSKVFAKRFMQRHGIPTAAFDVFDDAALARKHLERASYPLVVKADGLAAGKGVILADDASTAISAANGMLSGREFGDAGRRIVIEEQLLGREASFFVLADGRRVAELASCQDYKRAEDGDRGPNTGGMGTYSPSAFVDDALRRRILESIVHPTIGGLAAEERPYRGVLYVGLMLTAQGPRVIEYNARFGDPETQVMMPRLDGDWLELLHACASGELPSQELRWSNDATVCIVMAARGYPGDYSKGVPIEGIGAVDGRDGVLVFHAGTARDETGRVVTSGGRVLGVTARGRDLATARHRAYMAVGRIRFSGEHHRNDIAADAPASAGQ